MAINGVDGLICACCGEEYLFNSFIDQEDADNFEVCGECGCESFFFKTGKDISLEFYDRLVDIVPKRLRGELESFLDSVSYKRTKYILLSKE